MTCPRAGFINPSMPTTSITARSDRPPNRACRGNNRAISHGRVLSLGGKSPSARGFHDGNNCLTALAFYTLLLCIATCFISSRWLPGVQSRQRRTVRSCPLPYLAFISNFSVCFTITSTGTIYVIRMHFQFLFLFLARALRLRSLLFSLLRCTITSCTIRYHPVC